MLWLKILTRWTPVGTANVSEVTVLSLSVIILKQALYKSTQYHELCCSVHCCWSSWLFDESDFPSQTLSIHETFYGLHRSSSLCNFIEYFLFQNTFTFSIQLTNVSLSFSTSHLVKISNSLMSNFFLKIIGCNATFSIFLGKGCKMLLIIKCFTLNLKLTSESSRIQWNFLEESLYLAPTQ